MSKTYLVAQREFVENMRTKTFWLGIFAAPIGLVIFYTVMFLIADKTDVRKFVIFDESVAQESAQGWFSKKTLEQAKKAAGAANAARAVDEIFDTHLAKHPDLRNRVLRTLGQSPGELVRSGLTALQEKDLNALAALEQRLKGMTERWKGEEFTEAERETLKILAQGLNSQAKNILLQAMEHQDIDRRFEQVPFTPEGEDSSKILDGMVQKGEIFAYIHIGADPLQKQHGSRYVSNNNADKSLKRWFERHATTVARNQHIARLQKTRKLLESEVADIRRRFQFTAKKIDESGQQTDVEKSDEFAQFAPWVFVYILWMTIFIAANMLLTNTVEEKSNRIIEVLLSSVSPSELMNGKIFGIAATGLVIVGSWAAFIITGIKLAPYISPRIAAKIGEVGLDALVQNPAYLGSFFAYFLTGYLFYAALLVAIGSVCNSLKEAQNLMQPVTFMLFVPLATMFPITNDPNGLIAKVITYIPMYTPFAMMNRVAGDPPLWEYVLSSLVILISLWVVFKGAARVFRVGVLMTGKPPKITEIIRWMRASSD